jgi:nucleoside-diphosphate-sugar epimerase
LDAIDCLLRVIDNPRQQASRRIFNIGNPASDVSVAELARAVVACFGEISEYEHLAANARIQSVASATYYGKYYQDIQARVPSVAAVRSALGWEPRTDLMTAIRKTLEYHRLRGDFVAQPHPIMSADHVGFAAAKM